MLVAKWNDWEFKVEAHYIHSFSELLFDFEAETEEVTNGTQKYVKLKHQKARSATLKVPLDAKTGADVPAALAWLQSAVYHGTSAHFYLGAEKLLPCELMLTRVRVTKSEVTPLWSRETAREKRANLLLPQQPKAPAPIGMALSYAEVELTFTQSARMDGTEDQGETGSSNNSGGGGGSSGSGGGSKKASVTQNTSATLNLSVLGAAAGAVTAAKATNINASRASAASKSITAKANKGR